VVAALALLIAMQATVPETRPGLRFACRMTAESRPFAIDGWVGEGRRFNLLSEGDRPLWGYRFEEGRIDDAQLGFSGTPDQSSTLPAGRDGSAFGLRITYALPSRGRTLVLQQGIEGDQPAVLVGDMYGEELATGVCTMRPNDGPGEAR
jgi:hypothetical protein